MSDRGRKGETIISIVQEKGREESVITRRFKQQENIRSQKEAGKETLIV